MLFFTFFPFLRLLFALVPIYEAYRAVFAAFRFRFSVRRRRLFLVLVFLLIFFLFHSKSKCTRILLHFSRKIGALILFALYRVDNRTTSITRLESMNLGRILRCILNLRVITNRNAIIVRSIHVISFFLGSFD